MSELGDANRDEDCPSVYDGVQFVPKSLDAIRTPLTNRQISKLLVTVPKPRKLPFRYSECMQELAFFFASS